MERLIAFRHTLVLLGLALPIVLLAWTWRRRGRALTLPFDHGTQRQGQVLAFVLRLAESVPALILALAILLLAGPQRWDQPHSKRVLTNIEFCVDVSGSMTSKFGDADRYGAAMDAINRFLDYRQGDAFGLTFFGNSVLHWVPLTSDVSAFRCAPPFMRPQNLPYWFGGTEIGKALLACQKVLTEREEGDRMIILVTDGYSADLGGGRDEEIARKLASDRITVFAVHIAEPPAPGEIVKITALTGGEVFPTVDQETLQGVFKRIDAMQQTRLEKTHAEAIDNFEPWCRVGLLLLATAVLAGFGLRYTPW
ncbi:MAG: vWA domain-containing protein [Planctomycetota bacterium]